MAKAKLKQGGIPDAVWNHPVLQHFIAAQLYAGYVFDKNRREQLDKMLFEDLATCGLTIDAQVVFATTKAGRYFIEDFYPKEHTDTKAYLSRLRDCLEMHFRNMFAYLENNRYTDDKPPARKPY